MSNTADFQEATYRTSVQLTPKRIKIREAKRKQSNLVLAMLKRRSDEPNHARS